MTTPSPGQAELHQEAMRLLDRVDEIVAQLHDARAKEETADISMRATQIARNAWGERKMGKGPWGSNENGGAMDYA